MRSGTTPMTGPLKAVDGSVGSPAVQFANAASTGWYKTTNGIGVSVNGTKVAEFNSGGLVSGARWIGELIPWTRLTAAPLTVLPYGQTLSRATYADLWEVAQVEIAAGNTFYNNGNGTTTFGIGDMRGRVAAGKDDMGGTAAGRLTSGYFGNGAILGTAGGSQNQNIAQNQLPNVTLSYSNSISVGSTVGNVLQGSVAFPSFNYGTGASFLAGIATGAISGSITSTGTSSGNTASINGGVTQASLPTAQPTIITNFVLFAGA